MADKKDYYIYVAGGESPRLKGKYMTLSHKWTAKSELKAIRTSATNY